MQTHRCISKKQTKTNKMSVVKIDAFKTSDNKIFTDNKEAKEHQTKIDIVERLNDTDGFSVDDLFIEDLGVYNLEILRTVGRMAEEILNNK